MNLDKKEKEGDLYYSKDLQNYEFLGDAVFEIYVAANIYKFSKTPSKYLSKAMLSKWNL
jgi:dsRNA-specific ribonuclease